MQLVRRQLSVRLIQQLAGAHVDHVRRNHRAVELARLNLDLCQTRSADMLDRRCANLLARADNLFLLRVMQSHSRPRAHQVRRSLFRRHRPEQLAIAHRDRIHHVERLENLLIRPQTKRAQEDRSQKLALAIDAHIQRVLLVVLKLYPAATVRNDLAQEVGAVAKQSRARCRSR